jgi:hypothetical protein
MNTDPALRTVKDPAAKVDKKLAVFGLFHTRAELDRAVNALTASGFRASDISALLPDATSTAEVAHEKHTKAPEGALAGATAGGVVGGTLGLLLGLGLIAIPGLGPVIAAGPIMAALAGMGVGGAVGTLTGTLVGMGIPEYEAKRYESFLNAGGALLAIHAEDRDWAKRARQILDANGAVGVDTKHEAKAKKSS